MSSDINNSYFRIHTYIWRLPSIAIAAKHFSDCQRPEDRYRRSQNLYNFLKPTRYRELSTLIIVLYAQSHVSCDRYFQRAVIVNDESHDSLMINERNVENSGINRGREALCVSSQLVIIWNSSSTLHPRIINKREKKDNHVSIIGRF